MGSGLDRIKCLIARNINTDIIPDSTGDMNHEATETTEIIYCQQSN